MEEVKEKLQQMSIKELRDALDFHHTHIKLILNELDERMTKLNRRLEEMK